MSRRPGERRELVLFTDGASRGNPGRSGAGIAVMTPEGEPVVERAVYLGTGTNNAAEYRALLLGLELVQELAPDRLIIKMDSELIVKQLRGEYRVRSADLAPFHKEALERIRGLGDVRILHVRREENRRADRLANQAIDEIEEP